MGDGDEGRYPEGLSMGPLLSPADEYHGEPVVGEDRVGCAQKERSSEDAEHNGDIQWSSEDISFQCARASISLSSKYKLHVFDMCSIQFPGHVFNLLLVI